MAIGRHYFFAGIVTPEDRRWSCLRQSFFLSKRGRFSAAEENEDNTQRETEHQRREEERKISLAGVVGREGSAY